MWKLLGIFMSSFSLKILSLDTNAAVLQLCSEDVVPAALLSQTSVHFLKRLCT
jgi:hypothetical protein